MLAALIFLGALLNISAASVQVSWDPQTYDYVPAFHVFYGTSSGNYTNAMTFDDPDDVIIDGLQPGVTYYFAVSVSESDGTNNLTSPLSSEVAYTVPIFQTILLQTQPYTDGNGNFAGLEITASGSVANYWELDYSTDLVNWNPYEYGYGSYVDIFTDVNDPTFGGSPHVFFRLQNDN